MMAITAGAISAQTSVVLKTDEINVKTEQSLESNPTFNERGDRVSSQTYVDTLTVNDVDDLLYTVKTSIQTAVDADREQPELKMMSRDLTEYINTQKIQRLTVKTITVSNMPLHLICLQLGLSYQAAERLLKLNPQISCPNFVDGAIQVYVA
jgi:prophage DNA circulation protein